MPAETRALSRPLPRLVAYPVLILVVVGVVVYALRFSPAAVQHRNMSIAREHNVGLQRRIAGDDRFTAIDFTDYTGLDGGGAVSGEVRTRADADYLEKLVRNSRPPRPVLWNVLVKDDPEGDYEMVKPRTIMPPQGP